MGQQDREQVAQHGERQGPDAGLALAQLFKHHGDEGHDDQGRHHAEEGHGPQEIEVPQHVAVEVGGDAAEARGQIEHDEHDGQDPEVLDLENGSQYSLEGELFLRGFFALRAIHGLFLDEEAHHGHQHRAEDCVDGGEVAPSLGHALAAPETQQDRGDDVHDQDARHGEDAAHG